MNILFVGTSNSLKAERAYVYFSFLMVLGTKPTFQANTVSLSYIPSPRENI
jgi:hypothetical protein